MLLQPGKALLNQLRYPHKFLLISLLLIAPLALAIGLLQSETRPRIAFTAQELAGSRYLRPLRQLLEATLEDRLLAQQAAQGEAAARPALAQSRQRVSAALEALRAADRQDGARLATGAALDTLEAQWRALDGTGAAADGPNEDAQHLAMIASIRELIALVGDRSNLILDPELASYYLMDAVLLKLPEQADLIAQAQAAGQHAAAPGEPSAAVIAGLLRQSSAAQQKGLAVSFANEPHTRPALAAIATRQADAVAALSTRVEQQAQGALVAGDARAALSAAGSAARAASFALWDATVIELDAMLQRRIDSMEQKNALAGTVALVLLAAVLYLLAAFYRSVMETVAALAGAAQHLQAGGSNGTVTLAARDELGDVARSFNTVAAALVNASAERAAAEAEQARLQHAIIAHQQAQLLEMSTPLIPVSERVLVMPLIGTLDAARIERMIAALATGIAERRASTVILDMTGVPALDPEAARGLAQATQVARVLGAQVVITGIRAEVARALVDEQMPLSEVTVHRNLQSGIAASHSAP